MSSAGDPGQLSPPQHGSPPYAPRYIGLGGLPAKIPDVPITVVFLLIYLLFAVIHIKIMNYNKHRGHKFIFNGALFGFCQVRIITMSMRIAWACYPRNVALGIAAQIFVHVGTIILYLCNWFFAQRVVRAQHPRFGWSTSYRIVHGAAMVALLLALLLVMVSSVQQFYTLDDNIIHRDRNIQLAGVTYFGAFTLAPLVLLATSLSVPRKGTEKFGAGRLRNAIAIVIAGSAVLALGQCFRTIIGWLPGTPLRNAQGQINASPWYLSRASFYCFNLLPELVVVIFYAVMRVDLRFHVPDGSKQPGDYRRGRSNQFRIGILGTGKGLKRGSGSTGSIRSLESNKTIHEYSKPLFDETSTLADSLHFQSSVMELDDRTGHWKVKRMSTSGSLRSSLHTANRSQSSLWDPTKHTYIAEDVPPVPSVHPAWPLRDSQLPLGKTPIMEHQPFKSPRNSSRPSPEDDSIALTRPGPAIQKEHAYMPSSPISWGPPPNDDYRPPHSSSSAHPHELSRSQSTTVSSKEDYEISTMALRRYLSSSYSESNEASINTEAAEREFARFSFEASPRLESWDEIGRQRE